MKGTRRIMVVRGQPSSLQLLGWLGFSPSPRRGCRWRCLPVGTKKVGVVRAGVGRWTARACDAEGRAGRGACTDKRSQGGLSEPGRGHDEAGRSMRCHGPRSGWCADDAMRGGRRRPSTGDRWSGINFGDGVGQARAERRHRRRPG